MRISNPALVNRGLSDGTLAQGRGMADSNGHYTVPKWFVRLGGAAFASIIAVSAMAVPWGVSLSGDIKVINFRMEGAAETKYRLNTHLAEHMADLRAEVEHLKGGQP